MISEKLTEQIISEGEKKNYYIASAGGEYDENGEFVFVIKLKNRTPPTLGVSVEETIDTKDKPG